MPQMWESERFEWAQFTQKFAEATGREMGTWWRVREVGYDHQQRILAAERMAAKK